MYGYTYGFITSSLSFSPLLLFYQYTCWHFRGPTKIACCSERTLKLILNCNDSLQPLKLKCYSSLYITTAFDLIIQITFQNTCLHTEPKGPQPGICFLVLRLFKVGLFVIHWYQSRNTESDSTSIQRDKSWWQSIWFC